MGMKGMGIRNRSIIHVGSAISGFPRGTSDGNRQTRGIRVEAFWIHSVTLGFAISLMTSASVALADCFLTFVFPTYP